jgi:aryl-alcohol dehydrogenase-like predicted oxidoreductase
VSDELRIERRPVPGTPLRTSVLGLELTGATLGPPSNDPRNVALIRHGRSIGVTTFSIGPGLGGARSERLLSGAFPEYDPEVVIVARRSLRDLAAEEPRSRAKSPGLEARLRASLEASNARLAPLSIRLLEWRSDDDVPGEAAVDAALDRLRQDGLFAGRVIEAKATIDPRPAEDGRTATVELVTGELSPLDRSLLPSLRSRAELGPLGFFARNPLGGGRLDGTSFDRTLAAREPAARPPTLRELHREFEPVLALGFLTAGGRRTLAQASLQFVLHWPWVCSAFVALPPPERLRELLATATKPPLTEEEVERVLALGAPGR